MADDRSWTTAGASPARFPRSLEDLTDLTRCPACFTPLHSTVCDACGLDLRHPAAQDLAALSLQSAALLVSRAETIARMRAASAPAPSPVPVPPAEATLVEPFDLPTPTPPRTAGSPASATSVPAAAAPTVLPDASESAPAPAPGQATARRSGVQLVLLIAGVSLLSVAAVFFLVYAFFTYGLVWQSVIIGALTLAAIATSWFLARRHLRATAEGIAVFGVVLVLLDVWAIRANDLFGTGAVEEPLYWGAGVLLAAAVFVSWHRTSALRAPGVAGFGLALPGVWLLSLGMLDPGDEWAEVALAAAITTAAGVLHRFARFRTESVIVGSLAAVAAPVSMGAAFGGLPADDWGAALLLPATIVASAVLALSHIVRPTAASAPAALGFGIAAAATTGIALAAIGSAVAARTPADAWSTFWPLVSAAAVALLLEIVARRAPLGRARAGALAGMFGALLMAAGGALGPIALTLAQFADIAAGAVSRPWSLAPTDVRDLSVDWAAHADAGLIGLWVVLALTVLAWLLTDMLTKRRTWLAWAFAMVAVLSIPALGAILAMAITGSSIAALAVAVLVLRPRDRAPWLRAPLGALAVAAGTIASLAGWSSIDVWWWSAPIGVALLLAGRAATARGTVRAGLLAVAASAFLVMIAAYPAALNHVGVAASAGDTEHALIVAAALLISAGAAPIRALTAADRHVLFWIGLATASAVAAAITLGGASPVTLLDADLAAIVAAAALLAALLLWLLSPATRPVAASRLVAALVLAPAVTALMDAALFAAPGTLRELGGVAAALLVAVGALAREAMPAREPAAHRLPRWVAEIGVGLVLVPQAVIAVGSQRDSGWLAVLLIAITVLIASVSVDGLFGSVSRRRFGGWAALALGVAALWWRLGDRGVTDIEPYVLPLGGVLALIALALHAATRRRRARASSAAPLILLAGLLVATLPIGVIAADGSNRSRLLVIAVVSATLLLAGSLVRSLSGQRWLDMVAAAGVAGTVVTFGGRALSAAERMPGSTEVDLWGGAAFAVLLTAALGLARRPRGGAGTANDRAAQDAPARPRSAGTPRDRRSWSPWVLALGIAVLLTVELVAISSPVLGERRALIVVLVLSGLHVIARWADVPPCTRALGWVAISAAAIMAVVAVATARANPGEQLTVPIAAALLVTGALHLAAQPHARSWAWLAPGTTALLVPSLIWAIDDPLLWRLVALGVLSVGTLVAGLVLRLQAPFLLGAAVTIAHGIATFLPQLRAVYEAVEWWAWLGIGGAILIALAVRYERRIRDAREAVRRIAAMR